MGGLRTGCVEECERGVLIHWDDRICYKYYCWIKLIRYAIDTVAITNNYYSPQSLMPLIFLEIPRTFFEILRMEQWLFSTEKRRRLRRVH